MGESRYFFNPLVEDTALGKRIIEGMSGKGGLQSLIWWLDNFYVVDENRVLVDKISENLAFYDTAIAKCAKENLRRPVDIRQYEISRMLGFMCPSCSKKVSTLQRRDVEFCSCGNEYIRTYKLIRNKLKELHLDSSPETVLMWMAFEGLADAYVDSFKALKNAFDILVKQRNWENPLQFVDFQMHNRLESMFLYAEPGDMNYAKEERETLMLVILGNLAQISLKDIEPVIRSAIDCCKFGSLFSRLGCSGADLHYIEARKRFSLLYNHVTASIMPKLVVTREESKKKRSITVKKLEKPEFFVCALMNPNDWQRGKLSEDIVLTPLDKGKFPIFSGPEHVAMNLLVGIAGSGKTTFMSSNVFHAVNWAGEYVINVYSDEKNGLTLAGIPLFPWKDGLTNNLLKILRERDIQPQPIPCLNLSFIRENEEKKLFTKEKMNSHPPTIFDRIVEIDEPYSFGLDFWSGPNAVVETKDVVGNRGVLNILEEFALALGYKNVCGIVNAVNYLRTETVDYGKGSKPSKTKPDVQIGAELLDKFCIHRQDNKTPSARALTDELSRFAPVMFNKAGQDTSMASATFNEAIKAMRGMNTSVDAATQSYNEVAPESKKEAFNLLFPPTLPKAADKAHSQRDLVLGSCDLVNGDAERDLVKYVMETKQFPKSAHLWFWYNRERGRIDVVQPTPSPFMINQPSKTNLEVFRAFQRYLNALESSPNLDDRMLFEKWSSAYSKMGSVDGVTVLLKSWDDVPRLRYENSEYVSF